MGFVKEDDEGEQEIFNVSWIDDRMIFHQMVQ